jgi:phosphoglucosamine mutase
MLDNGTLTNKQVIVTPMSNLGLRVCFNKLGIECKNAGIGDRLVLEKMKQEGAILGGEQSGHVIFLNKHTTGDGIVTSLQLISAIKQSGKPLSELAKIFETAPQVLINIDVKDKPELDTLPEVSAAIKAAEEALGDMGRILVRYSGTQPMCRVMVEASSIDIANSISTKIADLIRKTIGK